MSLAKSCSPSVKFRCMTARKLLLVAAETFSSELSCSKVLVTESFKSVAYFLKARQKGNLVFLIRTSGSFSSRFMTASAPSSGLALSKSFKVCFSASLILTFDSSSFANSFITWAPSWGLVSTKAFKGEEAATMRLTSHSLSFARPRRISTASLLLPRMSSTSSGAQATFILENLDPDASSLSSSSGDSVRRPRSACATASRTRHSRWHISDEQRLDKRRVF
mmetsp:Transcript_60384/g.95704  ORF Transcript_60384/g.95704 Transcript_60384/m.95704 type:complete len:222 (+) Transcript_60384:291-956(+)